MELFRQIKYVNIEKYATDCFCVYKDIIPDEKHITSKKETCHVENFNSRLRHYSARLKRRTFCYTKKPYMLFLSILLFINKEYVINGNISSPIT